MALGLPSDPALLIALGALLVLTVALLALWWWARSRGRLIEDLPTTSVAGVVLGLNEVVGRVSCPQPAVAPISGLQCVWWERQYFTEDSDGKTKAGKKKTGGVAMFELTDESGSVQVLLPRAEVHGEEVYNGPVPAMVSSSESLVSRHLDIRSNRGRTVTEWVVPVTAKIYVLGSARLPADGLQPVIGRDLSGADPLIISTKGEDDLVSSQKAVANLAWLGSLVASVSAAMCWGNEQVILRPDGQPVDWAALQWLPAIAGAWIWSLFMAGASMTFLYNGLITLRNRAAKAWSLIDVELRRRHDLVPELVRVVAAHSSYEASVQEDLAALRSAVGTELDAQPSDDAVAGAEGLVAAESSALRSIFSRAEAYPEVTASDSFKRLQVELVETEDRIARARHFYNESVKVLRDRAHTFPSAPVAWLFDLELHREFVDSAAEHLMAPATGPLVEPVGRGR